MDIVVLEYYVGDCWFKKKFNLMEVGLERKDMII